MEKRKFACKACGELVDPGARAHRDSKDCLRVQLDNAKRALEDMQRQRNRALAEVRQLGAKFTRLREKERPCTWTPTGDGKFMTGCATVQPRPKFVSGVYGMTMSGSYCPACGSMIDELVWDIPQAEGVAEHVDAT